MATENRLTATWLTLPETRTIMAALETARPRSARFVGGCVRNTLRGATVDDIDIATQLTPQETLNALEAAGIRAIPTGIEHGTVTAVVQTRPFEITSLRKDVETDGRRAVVEFTEDWAEDAERRDFRLNAIYAEADGSLHEIVPDSIADALEGRVIFIGDARERIREDYLRILRFFRFNAWYGAGVDRTGLAACAKLKDGLTQIAAERKWKELKRLLEAPDPGPVLLAMEESGVLDALIPGAMAGVSPALVSAEAALGLDPDPMQRLMALIPRRGRDVATLAAALRLSRAEKARLMAWAAPGLGHVLGEPDLAIREAAYWYTKEAVADRALVDAAQTGRLSELAALRQVLSCWVKPVFPVGGDDAMAAGLTGKEVGEVLLRLEESWVGSDFKLRRADLLERLKTMSETRNTR